MYALESMMSRIQSAFFTLCYWRYPSGPAEHSYASLK